MDKTEIAASLRQEMGRLEVSLKKVQARIERLKQFVLDLEDEIAGPATRAPLPRQQIQESD